MLDDERLMPKSSPPHPKWYQTYCQICELGYLKISSTRLLDQRRRTSRQTTASQKIINGYCLKQIFNTAKANDVKTGIWKRVLPTLSFVSITICIYIILALDSGCRWRLKNNEATVSRDWKKWWTMLWHSRTFCKTFI